MIGVSSFSMSGELSKMSEAVSELRLFRVVAILCVVVYCSLNCGRYVGGGGRGVE